MAYCHVQRNYYHSENAAEFQFLEPPREKKIAFKNREIRGKPQRFNEEKEMTFNSSYRENGIEKVRVREIGIPL